MKWLIVAALLLVGGLAYADTYIDQDCGSWVNRTNTTTGKSDIIWKY